MATQPKKLNESLFTSGRNRKEIGFVFIENGYIKDLGLSLKRVVSETMSI